MFNSNLLRLAQRVLDQARAKQWKLSTAESCTGGLVAGLLTEIPGASDVFDRGYVTYSNAAKSDLLGVPASLLAENGAVSEAVARAMAEGAIRNSSAQLALSVTGIAGPSGGMSDKPVGLVHIAAAREARETVHERHLFGDVGRHEIRTASVEAALELLLRLF